MQELRRGLGDEPADRQSKLHYTSRYGNLLREKAALVIVEDVW